jgi:hypothetical protein
MSSRVMQIAEDDPFAAAAIVLRKKPSRHCLDFVGK